MPTLICVEYHEYMMLLWRVLAVTQGCPTRLGILHARGTPSCSERYPHVWNLSQGSRTAATTGLSCVDTAGPEEILCIVFSAKLRQQVKSLQSTVESLLQTQASASSALLARAGRFVQWQNSRLEHNVRTKRSRTVLTATLTVLTTCMVHAKILL